MDFIHVPDPVQLSESRIDRLEALYVDEHTCMLCGAHVEYELICMTHDGPAMCEACAGYPFGQSDTNPRIDL